MPINKEVCNITIPLDITIVGGGLVGASLALALGQAEPQRRKIMLVDAFPLRPKSVCSPSFSSRTTALSHSSKVIYEKLGIWQALSSGSVPIETIHVSEQGRWGTTRLVANEHGLADFGHVAPNELIGQALLSALVKQRKVILESPSQVTRIDRAEKGYEINIRSVDQSGPEIKVATKLLVIADGGRSSLLEQLGIGLESHDYQQSALVTNVIVSRPHQKIAYERFTDSGAIALLPLPDIDGKSQYSLVWTLATEKAGIVGKFPENDFLAELQRQIGYRCGKFISSGPVGVFPLSLSLANEQVRPGLVVLGNAAHTLHPVAGQGYNLSLRDAMTLAELTNRVTTNDELQSYELVREYMERQQSDQRRVIKVSDGLIKVFGSRSQIIRRGRQLGLIALNLLPPAKQQFADMAMGISGVAANWKG